MKSDGAVDEAQTSAVTKSLSDGMDGNDEKDAAGDLEVTYAEEPDDELDGCNNGVSEDTLGSLRGGLEETDDGVGVGLLEVLPLYPLEVYESPCVRDSSVLNVEGYEPSSVALLERESEFSLSEDSSVPLM